MSGSSSGLTLGSIDVFRDDDLRVFSLRVDGSSSGFTLGSIDV